MTRAVLHSFPCGGTDDPSFCKDPIKDESKSYEDQVAQRAKSPIAWGEDNSIGEVPLPSTCSRNSSPQKLELREDSPQYDQPQFLGTTISSIVSASTSAQKSTPSASLMTSPSKKDRYRITQKKLLKGILDETQRRTLSTSSICIDPDSWRGCAIRLVQAHSFTYVVSFMVMANAVFIGIETEVRRCGDLAKYDAWYVLQVLFSLAFCSELGIRLFAERTDFFHDAWNLFDSVVVIVSACDTAVLHHLEGGSTVDLILVLRILRLVRLVRIFRLLRFFKELWLLVGGMFDAVRTLSWAWLLIFLMIYIPAIFATRMFGKPHEDDSFLVAQFGTLPRSMYTLFQVMTGEGWADIARRVMKVEKWSWIFFLCFIFATTFALMHVVVAVIVQNTVEHASHCREEEKQSKAHREQTILAKILEVFEMADSDCDGEMSRLEFLQSLQNPTVLRHLHEINVDVRQAENLFDILDYDESGNLDLCEFVEGVLRARGEAKAKDVLAVQCDMWRVENRLLGKIDDFSSGLSDKFGLTGLQGAIARFKEDMQPSDNAEEPERERTILLHSAEGEVTKYVEPLRLHIRMLKLQISIIGAHYLRNADLVSKSDAYCLCEVPGKPGLGFRTRTIKDNLHPVWEHTDLLFPVTLTDKLRFTVMDEDIWPKPDDFLGSAIVTSQTFYPNGFEGTLNLKQSGKDFGSIAKLRVRIVVNESE